MKKKTSLIIIVASVFIVFSFYFMFRGTRIKTGNREMPEATAQTEEIIHGVVIEQSFTNITEDISEIAVVFSRSYYLEEEVNIVIELLDSDNNVLISEKYNADDIKENHRTYLKPANSINGYVGKQLTLRIYTESSAGTGLYVMYSDKDSKSSFLYGNEEIKGTICFSVVGKE